MKKTLVARLQEPDLDQDNVFYHQFLFQNISMIEVNTFIGRTYSTPDAVELFLGADSLRNRHGLMRRNTDKKVAIWQSKTISIHTYFIISFELIIAEDK